ncbi:non-ribosomal peptide synthetase [Andreprevotia chitinilytica]|uniref:non-ribosomal peptide synthetase n=1 Tax=Andreprevotia chitinilytica TaxID=396808 RepID=UPI00055232EC|nr:non-ribosomal peptide synthetase [Andreprevotia chitinilytica]
MWALLDTLRRLQIHLNLDGDKLILNALPGVVTDEIRADLRLHKAALIDHLRQLQDALSSDRTPLSYAQQRLWFLDRFEPGSATYNTAVALRLRGQLDIAALKAAFAGIVARHDALRTTFGVADDQPYQIIAPALDLALPLTDLAALPADAREAQALQLARDAAETPFDLSAGPLLRTALLRLSEDEHILLLTMHHIVTDGWSMGILIDELARSYAAHAAGHAPALPPLTMQYADFARWQKQWLASGVLNKQLDYWTRQLAGVPTLLTLPTDRPRPPAQSFRGDRLPFVVPAAATAALHVLSRQSQATLFMALSAVFDILLAKHAGQQDICVSTPIANRQRSELEPLIGLFVNLLVLRTHVDPQATFAELLQQVRRVTFDAYEHQDVPFDRLIDALKPERHASHSPLFQVMLVLQNAQTQAATLPGLTLENVDVAWHTAKYDLTLDVQEVDGQLRCAFEYNTDLFDRDTIARMAGHFTTLLDAILADPARRIGDLPWLTAAETKQLLWDWNATTTPQPAAHTIHQLFEAQVAKTPDHLAAVFEGQELTYAELNAQANQLAHYLRSQGVGPDVAVGVCTARSLDMLVGFLGILKAGGAYVPLDPAYPEDRLAYMLADAQPRLLLTQRPLLGRFQADVATFCLDERMPALAGFPATNPSNIALPGHLAYVIYTSGSTGQPKGVGVQHGNASVFIDWACSVFDRDCLSRVLAATSVCFDLSIFEMFVPLSVGGSVWVVQDVLDVVAKPDAFPVTLINTVPSAIAALQRSAAIPPSVKVINLAGEALPNALVQSLYQHNAIDAVFNLYGPTEDTTYSTYTLVAKGSPAVTIGRPIANSLAYLLDAEFKPVPVGVAGELYLAGAGLARGYLNRPDLTAEKFIPNPFSQSGERMYRTGDLARYLPDGNIEYLGRIDHQVKVRGFRIELGEIEAALAAIPAVRDAVVLAREDEPGDRQLVAYLVFRAGQTAPEPAVLRSQLLQRLPDYMAPAHFVVLEQLPLTPNGKVDRKALPAPERTRDETGFVAPRNDTEAQLATIWAEVLKLERVGVHDDFFELGGHSLLAVTLTERMRRAGLAVDIRTLFNAPTIAAVAATSQVNTAPTAVPPNLIPAGCDAITPAMLPLIELTPDAIATIVATVPGGAANIQDIYPLAPLQEGILFHHLLHEQGDTYLLKLQLSFDSRARLDRFTAALQTVIDRHDTFRTAVLWQGLAEPVQVVLRSARLPVEDVPLAALDNEYDPRRYRLAVSEAPLMRAFVAEDADQGRWLLQLLHHHLISDHTTLELLFAEVQTILAGQTDQLPVPLPFRNFIAQARLGIGTAEHEAFFTDMLGAIEEPTAPYGVLDVHGDGADIEEAHQAVPAELAQRIRHSARTRKVSTAALMHLAWGVVLARLTGHDAVVFGTILFGRLQGGEGADRVMGLCINTLPIRIDAGTASVDQALRGTQSMLTELLRHEHASLVQAQRCSGVAASVPLFSSLLNYRYSDAAAAASPVFDGMEILRGEERTSYPLTVSIDDLGEGFALTVLGSRAVHPQQVCAYLGRAIEQLVVALESAPHASVATLGILSAAERKQLVTDWNATATDYPQASIQALFEQQAAAAPERVAALFDGDSSAKPHQPSALSAAASNLPLLVPCESPDSSRQGGPRGISATSQVVMTSKSPLAPLHEGGNGSSNVAEVGFEQALSYGELNRRANQLAHALRARGVGPDVLVGLCAERSFESLVGVLGILKAGGAYLPLDPALPAQRLAYILSNAAPALVLSHGEAWAALGLDSVPSLRLDDASLPGLPNHNPTDVTSPDHLAYVMYTSGSTGQPKGVLVTHRNVVRLVRETHYFSLAPHARVLHLAPTTFDATTFELWAPLLNGAIVALPAPGRLTLAAIGEFIDTQRIDTLWLTSALFNQMVDHELPRLVKAKHVLAGGEALSPPHVAAFLAAGGRLTNGYGPTECTTFSCTEAVSGEIDGTAIPIGKPIANAQTYILDANLEPVPVGVAGELYIAGDGLARGYLNRPDLTAEKFVPNPFGQAGARMYRSGDLARYLPDGRIDYLGRIDQQVKLRGFRIELGEIEATLMALPGVRSAVVLAREDVPGDKRLVAYVVADAGQKIEVSALREQLGQRLPDYMVPAHFMLLDQLPLTPNGKVDRKALPAPERSNDTVNFVAPRNATETQLAAIWAEVLKLDRIGIHDNFFELGGHSLLATQVSSQLRRQLGRDLPLRQFFDHPTIAALATVLDAASAQHVAAPLLPLARADAATHTFPLSFAQQRLWFLDQFDPGSASYNIPAALRLQGELDVEVLRQAFEHLIGRHEALRTHFAQQDSMPVQVVTVASDFALPLLDLTHLPAAERADAAATALRDEANRPFDLGTGPLIRAGLIRLADDEHLLYYTLHHIVADGWSMGVLLDELTQLYQAQRTQQPAQLRSLPIQYADFAAWQRQWLTGAVLQDQLDYWRQQLTNAPALLTLPTDRPRPTVQSYAGASHVVDLPVANHAALIQIAQQHGCTPFMALTAAFNVLLSRYSGQTDLCIGTPIANRNRAETEGLIGFFVNTLVLRSHVDPQATFTGLLQQVRAITLAAYDHQDLPFEQLVEALNPVRDTSYTPLFQVMLVLQNQPAPSLQLPDLSLEFVAIDATAAKFDLTLNVIEQGEHWTLQWEYNTDLFDAATITRMAKHFGVLLAGIAADPTRQVSALPWLSETESRQLLLDWNDTAVAYPQDQAIHQLFEQHATQTPNQTALVFEGQQLSYGELDARANQLAHYLRSQGVGPDTLVGLCLERSLDLVIGLLAVLKAGGAYLPLDPDYPAERLAYMLADAKPQLVLTQARHRAVLAGQSVELCCLDELAALFDAYSTQRPVLSVLPQQLAYVIYTSGSTGRPKGTLLSHAGLTNLALAQIAAFGVQPNQRVLQFASFNFDAATSEIFMALGAGATLCLAAKTELVPGAALQMTLQQLGIQVATLPPVALPWLDASTLPALTTLIVAGEACPAALVDTWAPGRRFFNAYGPTETTVCATIQRCDEGNGTTPPIGRPIANTRVYLLDDALQPVPVGVAGELYVAGIGLARGYLGRPDLTAERFMPNPYGEAGERMYRSGDLARYLPDGRIEYLGRIDQQVKLRGFRIELGEIEASLTALPAVRDVVVLAREDEPGDKRLVAYLVANAAGKAIDVFTLREALLQRLPDYMIPAHFVVLDQLPLTSNGKVDRKALPAPERNRDEASFVAPRNATEAQLAAIWAEVLKLDRVGVHDNFFELGGHSLLATQLVSKVRQHFGIELALRTLFAEPTVAALSKHLAGHQQSVEAPPILPIDRSQPLPLSFAQQRLWFLDQFETGSAVYNMPMALKMTGTLDIAALRHTLNDVVARHEALRTTFITHGNEPTQHIHAKLEIALPVTDLSDLPHGERDAKLGWLAQDEARTPFDLGTGPLIRAGLIRLDATTHVLLLTLHHIVADGWSMGVLLDELTQLYQAQRTQRPAQLRSLPIQYADFAHWQRQWLTGAVLQDQLDYWHQQLTNAPALLTLPTDRPRPTVQSYAGASHVVDLLVANHAALIQLAQQHGCTPFMALTAAFNVLLSRYSGQTDLCIGTPIANRNRAETEGLIGFFVNTLVLRTRIDPEQRFDALLKQVREAVLEADAHQDLPFEQLVEALNPVRDTSYTPLFQVMLVLQNQPAPSLQLPDLSLEFVAIDATAAKFDLTLNVIEQGERWTLQWEYNTDLFDAATIARMAGHFTTLLGQIVAAPERRIADLGLLSAAESRQLLVEWNDTAVAYPTEQTIHQLFEQHAAQTPDQIALVFEDSQLSYSELDGRANQLAHYLRSQGVGPDVLVGLCLERSLDLVIGLLAVLKAGGAYLPLDPDYPAERLAYMLADAKPQLVLTQTAHRHVLAGQTVTLCCLDESTALLATYPTTNPALPVQPQQLAYVIYTSGSTGRPKGTLLSNASLVNLALAQIAAFDVQPGQRVLQFASFNFDAATSEIFMALGAGATLCLASKADLTPGQALQATLQQLGIQVATLPPVALPWLDASTLPALTTLIVAGEACPAALVDSWAPGRRFFNAYGPTETTVCATLQPCEAGNDASPPIGKPIANAKAYILDAQLNPVPVGVAGELYVAGAGLARGYLNRPDLTAACFVPNPFTQTGDRMYRSGDLARYLPDGRIEYLGRIDQQVKLRGFRIELGEIEASLTALANVRDAVVLAREDEPGDKRLVAYLVADTGQVIDVSTLREQLLQRLPDYMIPAHFLVLDQLPLTPNGKVDRKALPAPDRNRDDTSYTAPRNATETQLAAIWAEVLKLDRVGVHDNFFELGGHSLSATALTIRVREVFQSDLSVRAIFEAPTIESFARKLGITPTSAAQTTPATNQERNWVLVDNNIAKLDSPHTATHDIFFIPGAGGSAEVFNGVARSVAAEHANVFVFHHDGIDNEEDPLDSFAAMAEKYAPQVLRQRTGKIVLAGYCVGGLIGFELAQALQRLGFAESMLCFIDTAIVSAEHTFEAFDEHYFKSEFFKAICDTYSKIGEAITARKFDDMPLEACVEFAVERMALHSPHEHDIWRTILRQRYLAEKYHALATRQYWADHHENGLRFGELPDRTPVHFPAKRIESAEISKANGWGATVFEHSASDTFDGLHLAILKNHGAGIAKSLIEFIETSELRTAEGTLS